MKRNIRFSILVLLMTQVFDLSSQELQFNWATKTDGGGNTWTEDISVDDQGNIYTGGYFSGAEDFDSGNNLYLLVAEGGFDVFVSKHDSHGVLQWAFVLGSEADERIRSLTSDEDGNIYITGSFSGTLDFDHSAEVYELSAVGSGSFVAKYDTDGDFLWAHNSSSTGLATHSYGIALDSERNVYTAGRMTGTTEFMPGTTEHIYTAVGGSDIYIQKLNGLGVLQWVKQMGGTQNDEAFGIDIDNEANILITGFFSGTCDFNLGLGYNTLNSAGQADVFVAKLDSNGEVFWVKAFGGTAADKGIAITSDGEGNVFTTGHYKETCDFDPSSDAHELTSNGNIESFIVKLNPDGEFAWARSLGGELADRGHSILIDANGNVVSAGQFWNTVDLNPGDGESSFTTVDVIDLYILTLTNDGEFINANQIGGIGTEYYPHITMDSAGSLYVGGTFTGDCDFDPSDEDQILDATGSYDAFIVQMVSQTLGINDLPSNLQAQISPNPTTGVLSVSREKGNGAVLVTVYDELGRTVKNTQGFHQDRFMIELDGPKGLYFLEIRNDKGMNSIHKVIKE